MPLAFPLLSLGDESADGQQVSSSRDSTASAEPSTVPTPIDSSGTGAQSFAPDSIGHPIVPVPPPAVTHRARGVKPSTALYHSLFFPGWGQLDNSRKKKAALLLAAESFLIGGYIYTNRKLNRGSRTEWEQEAIRSDRNTYLLYWMIAKIVGMVDAYVDAQLRDFDVSDITPDELKKEEPAEGEKSP